jgi:alpha-beta hydrolase superfamily lysophospholipase
MGTHNDWDVLGQPYERIAIPLPDDDEGEVVATLVRYVNPVPTRRAVLYLHGFVDYFFQTEMAGQYVEQGFNFYALDLRKYGRSLLPHQTPNLCRAVDDYFAEIDRALDIITADGNHQVLLNGHSTGGLTAALYTHHVRNQGRVDALFLNSPFFAFNEPRIKKEGLLPLVSVAGLPFPRMKAAPGLSPVYGLSLHQQYHGEWDYNLAWKPLNGFPVRAGWVRAIHRAHQRVEAGLHIDCPVLVMVSEESSKPAQWDEKARRTDTVLDVRDIARVSDCLGDRVTKIRIAGGLHDLVLSQAAVRQHVYDELFRWLDAYLPPLGADS